MSLNIKYQVDDLTSVVNMIRLPADTDTGYIISRGWWPASPGFVLDSRVDFGYQFNPTGTDPMSVRLFPGDISHGIRDAIVVPTEDILIDSDGEYVWISYVYGSGEAFWQPTSEDASTTKPKSDATTLRVWKYRFRIKTPSAPALPYIYIHSTNGIGHLGSIIIPGVGG